MGYTAIRWLAMAIQAAVGEVEEGGEDVGAEKSHLLDVVLWNEKPAKGLFRLFARDTAQGDTLYQ